LLYYTVFLSLFGNTVYVYDRIRAAPTK